MSLLPPIFQRGDRLYPLGTPTRQPAAPAPAAPVHDWRFATAGDNPPKMVRLCLTDDAEAEADDFRRIGYHHSGCSCFTGCAPCSWCTHPGNPLNLEEDDSAWVMGYATGGK